MTIPFEEPKGSLLAHDPENPQSNMSADNVAAELMRIGNRYAALPDTGQTPDGIVGYDEHGLPTR